MQIVKRLDEFGEDNFIGILDNLILTNLDKNRDWFPVLRLDYKSKYLEWFFVVDTETDECIAFSTIQKFYDGCYRVLTRCYIDEKHRRVYLPQKDAFMSPGNLMIIEQIKYLKTYETLFISLQGIRRQHTIQHMSNKMEIATNLKWEVVDRMMQTCPSEKMLSCWQNVCYTGKLPVLSSVSKDEWVEKHREQTTRLNTSF